MPPAGVEYIISRRLYEGLPDEEKRFWHSHVYEVRRAKPALRACATLSV